MLQSRASHTPGTPEIPTAPTRPVTPGKPRGPRGPSEPFLASAGFPGKPVGGRAKAESTGTAPPTAQVQLDIQLLLIHSPMQGQQVALCRSFSRCISMTTRIGQNFGDILRLPETRPVLWLERTVPLRWSCLTGSEVPLWPWGPSGPWRP